MQFRYPDRARPWLEGFTAAEIEAMPFKEFWRLRNKWYYQNVIKLGYQKKRGAKDKREQAPVDRQTFTKTVRRSNFVALQQFPPDKLAREIKEMLR